MIGVDNIGRKPKPIELLLLQGTKHLTKAEIEQRQAAESKLRAGKKNIRCPEWLNQEAKKKWNALVKGLKEVDLLTINDADALAAYCDAYSQYVACTRIIESEGLMVEYTNKAGETNRVPTRYLLRKYIYIIK